MKGKKNYDTVIFDWFIGSEYGFFFLCYIFSVVGFEFTDWNQQVVFQLCKIYGLFQSEFVTKIILVFDFFFSALPNSELLLLIIMTNIIINFYHFSL